jgi:hypothetical protein
VQWLRCALRLLPAEAHASVSPQRAARRAHCVQVDTLVLESMLRAQLPAVLDHFNELKMGTPVRLTA